MFNFGTQELIIILVIALVIFGPGKLPEVGKAIGKSINEFKDAMSGVKEEGRKVKEDARIETIDVSDLGKNENKHVEKKDEPKA